MKIKMTDILPLSEHYDQIITQLFAACVMNNTELVNKIANAEGYKYETSEIDIKLLLNDEEIPLEPFLEQLKRNFDKLVSCYGVRKLSEVMPQVDFFEAEEQKKELEELISSSYRDMVENISCIIHNHNEQINSKIIDYLQTKKS
ncbi:hypothetical protein [uncultured Methanobrevibacter sp.]|jgi:hypothetical protein|uniref:hypothetical protein n=1 Tax=uncultured Methanobrevibacter sp. TaxID=253161 RepID=UPI0025F6125C|nr:hypothetical protein [uncultured Methanobrevibacter sp.]